MAEFPNVIADFERTRAQLMAVSSQKAQLQAQAEALANSIEELTNTKEEKVYRVAGNIMVLTDSKNALKQLQEQKESTDLRLKTVEKQETTIIDKLNKLKMEIEKSQGKKVPASKSQTEEDE